MFIRDSEKTRGCMDVITARGISHMLKKAPKFCIAGGKELEDTADI